MDWRNEARPTMRTDEAWASSGSDVLPSLIEDRPVDLRRLPVLLHRAREAFSARFRDVFAQHDLTDPQWRILQLIRADPSSDISDLARRSFLLQPSLSRILRDLSARNLIRRRPDPLDGRRAFHELTPEGARLIDEVTPCFDPVYEELADHLDTANVTELTRQLETLLATLRPDALD